MKNRLRVWCLIVSFLASVFAFSTGVRGAVKQTTVADILKRDREGFLDGLNGYLFSTDHIKVALSLEDLWLVMDRVDQERKKAPENHQLYHRCNQLILAIAQVGGQKDLERLIQVWEGYPEDSWHRGRAFIPLSDLWIKLELEDLGKQHLPIKVDVDQKPPVVPPVLQNAAPDLQRAWLAYQSVVKLRPSIPLAGGVRQEPWMRVQETWPMFYRVLGDLLRGKSATPVAQVTMFEWGGWCGTGSESLYEPKNRALFMAFLREKRYAEALSQVFSTFAERSNLSLYPSLTENQWQRRYIEMCGQDWQTLWAGAAVDPAYNSPKALHHMASHGSDASARLLALMHILPRLNTSRDYLIAVALMITPAHLPPSQRDGLIILRADGVFGLQRLAEPRIAADLQLQLLGILHDAIQPSVPLETAETVIRELARLSRTESQEALRRAISLPFTRPREQAVAALKAMGVTDVEVSPVQPVVLQLLVNSQPVANTSVEYELRGLNNGVSSSLETDSAGSVRLQRDYLVDPSRPITNIYVSTKKMKKPDDLWLNTRTSPPKDLDKPILVEGRTQRLSLRIQPPPGVGSPTLMTVLLKSPVDHSYGTHFENVSEPMSMPVTSPIVFSALQQGRYRLQIQIPGAARWESGEIELGTEPVENQVTLQRGADVHIVLAAPGKDPKTSYVPFRLLQNGKPRYPYLDYDYDYENSIFRGLAVGEYTLRVSGSAEEIARRRAQNEQVTESSSYLGTEVNFSITENSPALLDLGTVQLQKARVSAVPH